MVYVEDYQQLATCVAQSRRISRWIVANRFSYQQVIHILLPLHVFISERMIHGWEWVISLRWEKHPAIFPLTKSVNPGEPGTSMTRSKGSQPKHSNETYSTWSTIKRTLVSISPVKPKHYLWKEKEKKKEKHRQQIVVEEKYQEPLRALLIGEGQTNIQRLLDTPGNTSWKVAPDSRMQGGLDKTISLKPTKAVVSELLSTNKSIRNYYYRSSSERANACIHLHSS